MLSNRTQINGASEMNQYPHRISQSSQSYRDDWWICWTCPLPRGAQLALPHPPLHIRLSSPSLPRAPLRQASRVSHPKSTQFQAGMLSAASLIHRDLPSSTSSTASSWRLGVKTKSLAKSMVCVVCVLENVVFAFGVLRVYFWRIQHLTNNTNQFTHAFIEVQHG
jgi:hypothetical protein